MSSALAPHDHDAKNLTTELAVEGMSCANCARQASEALSAVPGVASAAADAEGKSASIRWKPGAPANIPGLIAALKGAGYSGTLKAESPATPNRRTLFDGWGFNVAFGAAVTAPLMILEWGFKTGTERWYHWLSFLLVLPVQILGGLRFYKGAWNQLKAGQSNMDTLVALGSTTAFLFSVWGLLAGWGQHLFFMDAAAILTLVSLGHWLEARMSARAASSLRALLRLAPETAKRVDPSGRESEVRVSELALGDRILLKAGDRVPVDGEVLEGASSVDESMLTGESMPAEKSAGAKVYAGTINESGQLAVRVSGVGSATALARIIEVVREAQSSRAEIQKLGDRVSSVFVPIVVFIALATGLWWALAPESANHIHQLYARWLWHAHFPGHPIAAAVYHAAAVLIVACPCAMGLATPAAIMAGTNAAARRGILIRDGAALEKSGAITAVLFDKTGTLTEGKPAVAAAESYGDDRTLSTAASLASRSTHPLSRAIAGHAAIDPARFTESREVRGSGIEAAAGGAIFRLGSLAWLADAGVGLSRAGALTDKWAGEGASLSGFARDGELLAVFALRDQLKPRAREVVEQLRRAGKKVRLITGDHRRTAEAIAAQLGLSNSEVHAEVRPEGKAAAIRALQSAGERVAFAGDGINDAPALEQADLGIALMNASDVARESADIILLKADLAAIPEALGLAQATLRTIKQNLFWAFFYNALAVPLAALGFLSPILSAAAMGASDLIVIGNALRLRRWRP